MEDDEDLTDFEAFVLTLLDQGIVVDAELDGDETETSWTLGTLPGDIPEQNDFAADALDRDWILQGNAYNVHDVPVANPDSIGTLARQSRLAVGRGSGGAPSANDARSHRKRIRQH